MDCPYPCFVRPIRASDMWQGQGMTRPSRYRTPALCAAAALLFAAAHLAFEHVNGGVRSHHLLDRADLPAISNWFGLVVLPVLGALFGLRIRRALASPARPGLLVGIWLGLGCAMAYGMALAVSFTLGASTITSGLFLSLFLLAAALPIYRVECILGFVVGMTFTFGAVLPALVATVFAAISVVLRLAFRTLVAMVRRPTRPPQSS